MRKSEPKNSIPLYMVLEEEYISLHGPLPDEHYLIPHDDRLAAIYKRIHIHLLRRSALCLSGGAFSSTPFALGIIQALARHNLLDKFDYISSVSDGSYISDSRSREKYH
jgi:hypothetical protein